MSSFATQSVLITGANRGIGLELVKQILSVPQPPKHVFTTCRQPDKAEELTALAKANQNLHIHKFDVTEFDSYPKLVEWVESLLEGEGLNLIINNSAVALGGRVPIGDLTVEMFRQSYDTNTIAPFMLTRAFLPLLKKASAFSRINGMGIAKAAIVNISTKVASVADNEMGDMYPYRSSKAALNMINKSLSIDLKTDGILAVVLHPGWVLTDMGGANALIDTRTSVQGLLNVMSNLSLKDNGCFYDYKGESIPW